MNWLLIAQRDWSLYKDPLRIKNFVLMGKISAEQYKEITDLDYVA
jgi:Phage uncharacterised protein (Phage_XkdX)